VLVASPPRLIMVRYKRPVADAPVSNRRLRGLERVVLAPVPLALQGWATRPPPSTVKAAVIRRLVMPKLRANGREFEKHLDDGRVFVGNTRDFIPLFVYVFGVWEPNLTAFIEARLAPGQVFVDVGANLGWFSVLAGSLVGRDGKVVAIEASPLFCDGVERNVEANQMTNVRIVNAAVGPEPGRVDIEYGPAEQTGLTRVSQGSAVEADTIQALVGADDLRRARLVKIDVEGGEYDVIRGFAPALEELAPDAEVVVEVGPERASDPAEVEALFGSFEQAGFHPFALPNSYFPENYLLDPIPESLARLDQIPMAETDVVFSRSTGASLPLR
jgi:FkbM family methyltransferase